MPDISGQQALDVAIGLVFVFFLLSILCSAINEAIASVLAWRSQGLLKGLRSMLADDDELLDRQRQVGSQATATHPGPAPAAASRDGVEPTLAALLDHPLVRSLVDETARQKIRRHVPSYVGSRTFALALIDTTAPDIVRKLDEERGATGGPPLTDHDVMAKVAAEVAKLGNVHVRTALLALVDEARGDVDRFRQGVESWFDTTMERASGWYTRRIKRNLSILAIAIVVALNADSYQIASQLWKDDTLRAAAVAQAQQAVSDGNKTDIVDPEAQDAASTDPASNAQTTSPSQALADVKQLELPIGWSVDPDDPRWPDDGWGFVWKLAGLAATAVAVSLGAPFWFDALNKVSRVRGGGPKPRPGGSG